MGLSYRQLSVVPSKYLEGLGLSFEQRFVRRSGYSLDTQGFLLESTH